MELSACVPLWLVLQCRTAAYEVAVRPLAIELFAGSFGWGEGLTAAGWRSVGFDIEQSVGRRASTDDSARC